MLQWIHPGTYNVFFEQYKMLITMNEIDWRKQTVIKTFVKLKNVLPMLGISVLPRGRERSVSGNTEKEHRHAKFRILPIHVDET